MTGRILKNHHADFKPGPDFEKWSGWDWMEIYNFFGLDFETSPKCSKDEIEDQDLVNVSPVVGPWTEDGIQMRQLRFHLSSLVRLSSEKDAYEIKSCSDYTYPNGKVILTNKTFPQHLDIKKFHNVEYKVSQIRYFYKLLSFATISQSEDWNLIWKTATKIKNDYIFLKYVIPFIPYSWD